MAPGSAYDDRDGFIWMDGDLVEWRSAKVHLLTHALHYGSAVFEGERAYGGRIFKSEQHSQRLLDSGNAMDIPIPYTVAEIEKAKADTMRANNMNNDAYVRVLCWRGSGLDMGVASARNPVHMAVAAWEWGAYYGDAKLKGAKLDISKWKRPSPETIPCHAKASGLYMICTMSKHAAEAKGCSDSLMMDYRGYVAEATGANVFFVRDGELRAVLAYRHRRRGHPGGRDRPLQLRGRRADPGHRRELRAGSARESLRFYAGYLPVTKSVYTDSRLRHPPLLPAQPPMIPGTIGGWAGRRGGGWSAPKDREASFGTCA
jgi:branched-chain amino acid aminotransferase